MLKSINAEVYPDYYAKALQDVLTNLENIKTDLKRHGMTLGMNNCLRIVKCMLDNRHILKETWSYEEGEEPFVRCNNEKDFEVYSFHHGLYNPDDGKFHCTRCKRILKGRNENCPDCGYMI